MVILLGQRRLDVGRLRIVHRVDGTDGVEQVVALGAELVLCPREVEVATLGCVDLDVPVFRVDETCEDLASGNVPERLGLARLGFLLVPVLEVRNLLGGAHVGDGSSVDHRRSSNLLRRLGLSAHLVAYLCCRGNSGEIVRSDRFDPGANRIVR